MIIDSHAHYANFQFDREAPRLCEQNGEYAAFRASREELIEKMKSEGIVGVIEPSRELEDIEKQIDLAKKHSGWMRVAVGVHPTRAIRTDWEDRKTIDSFAKHESETLEAVVKARNISAGARTPDEKMTADAGLTSSLRTFFSAVSESYPQLQANTNFLDLQNQLKTIEGSLESARRYYNGVVKSFNTKLELFPANLVVSGMGEEYKKRAYFELDNEVERQNVKVQF